MVVCLAECRKRIIFIKSFNGTDSALKILLMFQTYNAQGCSNGHFNEEWWYDKLATLPGMEFLRFHIRNNININIIFYAFKTSKKYQCESQIECVAYTFEQSRLNCILHSSTDKGLTHTRGKQTGTKKTDYILSLPEISLCSEQNRQKRCKREPKCQHVDCKRNILNDLHLNKRKRPSEIFLKWKKKNGIRRWVYQGWIWMQFK